jgi:hypothetical protein
MKNIFIPVALLIGLPLNSFAQKEDALWLCGRNVGLDFRDTASPKIFDSKQGNRIPRNWSSFGSFTHISKNTFSTQEGKKLTNTIHIIYYK